MIGAVSTLRPRQHAHPLFQIAESLRLFIERSQHEGRELVSNPGALEQHRAAVDAAVADAEDWPALAHLCSAFELSAFERHLLLLCASVQIAPSLLAAVPGAVSGHPTFALAFALFDERAWGALSPMAPLHRYRLLAVESGELVLHAAIRIDEGVLVYLLGVNHWDGRVRELVEPVPVPPFLPTTHQKIADRITSLWRAPVRDLPSVIQLSGEDAGAARAIAARGFAALGIELGALRCAEVPSNGTEQVTIARLLERERVLSFSALLVDLTEASDEVARGALELVERLQSPLVLATREPVTLRRSNTLRFDVPRPNAREQMEVWRHTLPDGVSCPPEALERVSAQFRGGWMTARDVAAHLRLSLQAGAPPDEVGRVLHGACRLASRSKLDGLASRVSSPAGWGDLVVPATTVATLHEIAAQLSHRTRVYEHWGFAERGDRGLGVSALFHGESGTGKTLAGEVIANELALDLYRVDLSRMVSKYIGETEKNLRRVFDAAEESGAVLLFDEADALFGKRSEVKDSHDRYANIEVSYLLSRMETYRGLAVLTTNFRQALDQAFLRRIRFVVHFPFPDAVQREAIWRRAFPAKTPTENLDAAALARLSVTGGSIRNIAIGAAFLAAESQQPVRPVHVLRAASTEYSKLGKALTEAETRGIAREII